WGGRVIRRDRDHRRPVNSVARLQAERRGQFADRILQYDYDKGRRARGASDKHPDRAAHQVSENAQKEMTESLILTRPRWRRSLRIGGRIGRLYLLINAQIAAQVPPTAFINGLHCQSTPSAHIGRLNVSAPLSKRERMKCIRSGYRTSNPSLSGKTIHQAQSQRRKSLYSRLAIQSGSLSFPSSRTVGHGADTLMNLQRCDVVLAGGAWQQDL